MLGLGEEYDPSIARIRVTNNDITSQVAGGVARGLFPASDSVPVSIQSDAYDSLEPSLSCPAAGALRDAYTSVANWTDHLELAQGLYDKLDAVSGVANKADEEDWHVSFDQYVLL